MCEGSTTGVQASDRSERVACVSPEKACRTLRAACNIVLAHCRNLTGRLTCSHQDVVDGGVYTSFTNHTEHLNYALERAYVRPAHAARNYIWNYSPALFGMGFYTGIRNRRRWLSSWQAHTVPCQIPCTRASTIRAFEYRHGYQKQMN